MGDVEKYFEDCVRYWTSTGCGKAAATARAIWWDCVETWNFDKSWTDEKVAFVNRYRKYEPYGPVPEKERVETGDA